MKSSVKVKKSNAKPLTLAAAVDAASVFLSKAQAALPIDDDLIERDRKAAVAMIKFPTEALKAAQEILATEKGRFSLFDASQVSLALTYDESMNKVLRQAQALVTSIQRTLWKHRAPGVEQTLNLYAWLKRASRTDGTVVKYVDALAPHVVLQKRRGARASKGGAAAGAATIVGNAPVASTVAEPAKPTASNGASPAGVPTVTVINGASAPPVAHA
jgi:hypothetical protein